MHLLSSFLRIIFSGRDLHLPIKGCKIGVLYTWPLQPLRKEGYLMIMPQLYITAESLVPSASFLPKSKAHWIKQSIRKKFSPGCMDSNYTCIILKKKMHSYWKMYQILLFLKILKSIKKYLYVSRSIVILTNFIHQNQV